MLKKNAVKLSSIILFVSLTFGIFLQDVSADSLFENYIESSGAQYFAGSTWYGQTFTASSAHTVTYIRLRMARGNFYNLPGDPGALEVYIYAAIDGVPYGGCLSSGSADASSFPKYPSDSMVEIDMYPDINVSAGLQYAILCGAPNAQRYAFVIWFGYSADGYSGGDGLVSINSGDAGSWSGIGYDRLFEVYGTSAGSTPTPTSTPSPTSTPTPTTTPIPTPMPTPEPEAHTYTVWKNGSKYYAKDAYGNPAPGYGSGNESASVIINACVDAINTGGEIAIRQGEFICTGTIYVTGKAILFKGTGKGEIGQAGTILTFNSSFNGFDINVNPGNVYTTSVTIEDMLIHGAPSTGTAIKSKGRYLTVRHVDIEQFGVGISLEMANEGYSAGDSLIDDCVIRHCKYQGVLIGSNDNRMSNVIVHHCWQGLELSGFSGGLNAYNIHLWGNRANGLLITNSSKDFFYNLQCDEDGNYNVVITPWANQNEYVRDIKFMNCFFWSDMKETVNPTYSGALYFGGDRTIDNVSIIGGKIGVPCYKEYTKMKKVGNNAIETFIRMVDLNDATNDPTYPFSTGSNTSDIYLCQGITP